MKVAFDTSVLIAGSIEGHLHHERASVWFRGAREKRFQACAATHAFAETWATLTAMPLHPRLPATAARRVVEELARSIRPLELSWQDYVGAIARCSDRDVRSGALYDALHLAAAERTGASVLLTFNTKHFTRLAGSASPRILAPPDPPALDLDAGG